MVARVSKVIKIGFGVLRFLKVLAVRVFKVSTKGRFRVLNV